MTQRYWPHFGSVFIAHMLLLFTGFKIYQTDYVQNHFTKKVFEIQMAKGVLHGSAQFTGTGVSTPVKAPQKTVKKVVSTPVAAIPSTNVTVSEKNSVPAGEAGAVGNGVGLGIESGVVGGKIADLKTMYKAELRARIDQNKNYPTLSRKLGQQGVVEIEFAVLADGKLVDIKIASPSKFEALNKAALDSVESVGTYKPIPKEIAMDRLNLKVPIRFSRE